MKNIKILFFIYISILFCNDSIAQKTKLDTLLLKIKTEKFDTSKANLCYLIGEECKLFNPDTSIFFFNKSLQYSKSFKSIINHELFIAQNFSSLGWVYCTYKGNCDTAIVLLRKALNLFSKHSKSKNANINKNANKGIVACHSRLGVVYINQGIYDKAIENFLISLRFSEKLNDDKALAVSYNNLGITYYYQGLYDKSKEYYQKSLTIKEKLNDIPGILACYNNIGLIFSDKDYYENFAIEKRDSILNLAIHYYQKSIEFAKQINDKQGLALCYTNMANITFDQVLYNKSNKTIQNGLINSTFQYYQKALEIYKELDDKSGIATVLANTSEFHNNIADSILTSKAEKNKHYLLAVKYGEEAIKYANEINAINIIRQTSLYLKTTYEAVGNIKQALKYANIFMDLNDTMFNAEKTQAFAEMDAKYKAEKKQFEIDNLQKQKALDNETIARKEAENNKQKIISFTFIFGFIVILLFVIIVFRLFVQKKKANIILSQQYVEIQQKNEEIISQRDEIEAQRDKLSLQNDILTEQKKDITDSITYAKRIQNAVLPTGDFAKNVLGEHFILFKPKDIVSGDFYWSTIVKKENSPTLLIVAVADCTGHGVPGAFMSMLGISFLNEIVRKKEIVQVSHILDELRVSIIDALKQTGQTGEQKDGMDISIVIIDTTNYNCQFAGANNPLYIVRKLKVESYKVENQISENSELSNFKNFELSELKGDNMPVAIYERMNNFTNNDFKINKGDLLYLFSDGYADQFGGKNERKFMYKEFKKLILEIASLPIEEQCKMLDSTIEKWKGNLKQTDDITVLGLKI